METDVNAKMETIFRGILKDDNPRTTVLLKQEIKPGYIKQRGKYIHFLLLRFKLENLLW